MLTVLSATRESPAFTDADSRRQFIAQSWLLVHYLLTERSREGQLSAFLDLLERHVEPERAFRSACTPAAVSGSAAPALVALPTALLPTALPPLLVGTGSL